MKSIHDIRKTLEKQHKGFRGFNLKEDESPTDIKDWIPTGSRWLDSIIARGKIAGIPVGRITEIAGLESTGKSYMAAQIAGNAQRMGYNVFYFDSENAIDSNFLELCGVDVANLLYIQATDVESVLENIETIMSSSERNLFVWDSLALTPCRADIESDFDPQSSVALKARILAKGLSKLVQPIANTSSALLVLNQLKTNIPTGPNARTIVMTTPYVTPGGKSLTYSYSLRIWLTGRKAKASFIEDEHGYTIGSEVKVKLEKSRFGTHRRICTFNIIWGDYDNVGIQDKQSWIEAIRNSPRIKSGSWWKIYETSDQDKKELYTFQRSTFVKKLDENKDFYNEILKLMDEEVIIKFEDRSSPAAQHYEACGKEKI